VRLYIRRFGDQIDAAGVEGVVSIKQNINLNIQPSSMLVFFVFHEKGVIKSCSSFEDISLYKMPWSHCLVLVLNPPQMFEYLPFLIVETTVFKTWRRGHIQW
jgi:hypothetical protein